MLSNTISQAIAREYAERFELSVTEWRVIAVLGRYSDVSASEVAERTAMDKVAVSRAVASLVDAGRVARGARRRPAPLGAGADARRAARSTSRWRRARSPTSVA